MFEYVRKITLIIKVITIVSIFILMMDDGNLNIKKIPVSTLITVFYILLLLRKDKFFRIGLAILTSINILLLILTLLKNQTLWVESNTFYLYSFFARFFPFKFQELILYLPILYLPILLIFGTIFNYKSKGNFE